MKPHIPATLLRAQLRTIHMQSDSHTHAYLSRLPRPTSTTALNRDQEDDQDFFFWNFRNIHVHFNSHYVP